MELRDISLALGIIVTTFTLIGGAWAFGSKFGFRPALLAEVVEVEQVAQSNQRQIMILRFFELEQKRERVGLSRTERAIWCDLGRRLGYIQSC